MQTDQPPPSGNAIAQQLDRMEHTMGDINARIARLAMALGVSLQSDDDITRAISRPKAAAHPVERRESADRRGDLRASSPERRVAHQWEELRGLLVLRYGVEKRLVDEVGVDVTRHIMVESEQRLERDGFKPGADGVDLNRLFDGS